MHHYGIPPKNLWLGFLPTWRSDEQVVLTTSRHYDIHMMSSLDGDGMGKRITDTENSKYGPI